MKKKIVVDYGKVGRIAKVMGCTREMASKSLSYKKDSLLARKIRYVAIKHFGGVEVGE